MTGVAGLTASVLAALRNSNTLFVSVTAALGVLFLLVSGYKVWKEENKKYQTELARNAKPEIKGEASGFEVDRMSGEGVSSGEPHANAMIRFDVTLCNHRAVMTNCRRLEIDGSAVEPPIEFSRIHLLKPGKSFDELAVSDFEMPFGLAVFAVGTAFARVKGKRLHEIGNIELAALKITLVDGLGGSHSINVKADQRLDLSEPI